MASRKSTSKSGGRDTDLPQQEQSRAGAEQAGKEEDAPPANLEDSLSNLEALVERMESGQLSMEESLEAFEQGIHLTRACQKALDRAEQKVQILLEQSPEAEPEDFSADKADDG